MGIDGEELSKDQGAAASEMQFVLIETFIQRGRDLIAESAFFKQIATPRIIDIIQKSDVNYVEIYCKADTAVWRQRFIERAKSGKRHPGHVDLRKPISEAEAIERYAPLGIGKVIEFDTTVISDQSYDHLLAKIKDCLKGV
jgi:predicted kinase